MESDKSQIFHRNVMRAICTNLADTPMVLKGGTALLLCYGLDRFSEDLDFDSSKKMGVSRRIQDAIGGLCEIESMKTLKDTDTVQRLRLVCIDPETRNGIRLKIETSFRETYSPDEVVDVNGIKTYTLNRLFSNKVNTLFSRTKARDVYDLDFILKQPAFEPDSKSIQLLHAAVDSPEKLNAFHKRFTEAFATDKLLSSCDPEKIILSLSDGTNKAFDKDSSGTLMALSTGILPGRRDGGMGGK